MRLAGIKNFISLFLLIFSFQLMGQNIGINEDGTNPDPSAILDVKADDKGMLIPRLTTAQRNLIADPATGLILYDIDTNCFWFYNGSIWISLSGGDADWYAEGSLDSPSSNSDDIYTMGNVAIGKDNTNSSLDILSNGDTAVYISKTQSNLQREAVMILDNELTGGSISNHVQKYGFSNKASGDMLTTAPGYSTGYTGINNRADLNTTGYVSNVYAQRNTAWLQLNSAGNQTFGLSNDLRLYSSFGSSGSTTGVSNYLGGSASVSERGVYNLLDGDNATSKTGIYNYLENDNSFSDPSAVYNGVYNSMPSLSGPITAAGTYNRVSGNAGAAILYGTRNVCNSTNGTVYGEHSSVYSGWGTAYGNYISMYNANGYQSTIFGIFDSIVHAPANTSPSYGMYVVNENLVNGFAGYFKGRMGIGTTNSNHYILPHSRGVNGQIMQTDGSGNVSWENLNVEDADSDASNEIQALSFVGSDLSLSNSNSVDLSSLNQWTMSGTDIYNSNSGNVGINNNAPNRTLNVGTTTGDAIGIGNAEYIEDGGGFILGINGGLHPVFDNVDDLGSATNRWDDVYATSGVVNTSDSRLKSNIRIIQYGLNEVLLLKPVSYNWKKSPDEGTKLGLLAQDLQEVIPEVVKEWEWKYDESDRSVKRKVDADRLGVYYSDLIPVLIKAIQEQNERIEKQEGLIENLIEKLDALERK